MAAKPKPITVTVLGVSAKANPEALDDYDLFEKVEELGVDSGSSLLLIGKTVFGKEGWKKVIDQLRDENGKLTMTRVGEFLDGAFDQIAALKN